MYSTTARPPDWTINNRKAKEDAEVLKQSPENKTDNHRILQEEVQSILK